MTGERLASDYVLEQYEALRREALAPLCAGARGHGLALVLGGGGGRGPAPRGGLAPPAPPRRPLEPATPGPRPLPAARAELTTLLAGVVLACARGPARWARRAGPRG